MSETTEAGVQKLRRDTPVLDSICRQIERQIESDQVERIIRFAELFFSKAPTDFLSERSADALAHMLVGTFRFLESGRADRVNVEVFNPDVDNEGWFAPVTVIRTNISERPFIIDTIREFLHAKGLVVERFIYPVLHVKRDENGRVTSISPSTEGESRESIVHCEISRVTDTTQLEEIRREVAERLQDVIRVTDDFRNMLGVCETVAARLSERVDATTAEAKEFREIVEFLEWLHDGAFVFLGYRGYDLVELKEGKKAIVVEPGSGLGILRNEADSNYAEPVDISKLPEALRRRIEEGPTLIISKTNAESTVHRRARMDYIGVKKLDENGDVVGEHRFIGLFTSKAFSDTARNIPILRQKLDQVLEAAGVQEGSHDYKEITTIFDSMPKEELFLASVEKIETDVRTVMTTYQADDVRVTLRPDPLGRGVSVMAILPKEKFSGDVRKATEQALIARLDGKVLNYRLALGEGEQARLHFYLEASPEVVDGLDAQELEGVLRELTRSWKDRVQEGLERLRSQDDVRRLMELYGDAFNAEYSAAFSPDVAVRDILELDRMSAGDLAVSISLTNPEKPRDSAHEAATELRLYLKGELLVLSDFMPILENMGLRVIGVTPFEVQGAEMDRIVIHVFAVQGSDSSLLEIESRGSLLANAILAVRAGLVTNDPLNDLVVRAGLTWREVDLLRTYTSYAFQLGAVPSRNAIPLALCKHPNIATILVRAFKTKFGPDSAESMPERRVAFERARGVFRDALDQVDVLADDRALRRIWTLIEATVRTNYYRCGGNEPTRLSADAPYISMKFASKAMQSIIRTRLQYEVWVRSARMEGVHLRGGKVARGGIRHSDRPDDFRTEVLGLVNTQMVKNAVIVPAGSKGGFITLGVHGSPEDAAEDVREQYETLMRGLLDVTDNLTDEGPVSPEGVVCFDELDPYLVVAADKGTARFSDVANGISEEYGFWLGDAFASGGSNGYDHKKVGITARGAWECVKRHFRELGKDIQSEPFTVVAIGDMSGDVFGNGMLLSEQIRLVAAFNHRHIFIDPDPDPRTSFNERKRLFELGQSTWEDYDQSLLSKGGTIVSRGAKTVVLSEEARVALGMDPPEADEELDGETLIRAILASPVELLWNGGIGTYVRSSVEADADVGDASNDAVRIDSTQVRAKVVGEGGNLGFTQMGRIEYALLGGRLNTDALDNSGGVDLSDREVNLKILLNRRVREGRLAEQERNRLLETLTDPVSALALTDNESQSRAVALDQLRAERNQDEFLAFMSGLERVGLLDRSAEHLPVWETLLERAEDGMTLTRPELSVLLSYAKLHLKESILRSDLSDDPAAKGYFLRYFPDQAIEVAGADSLEGHRLRREIIASQLTNDLVDVMGATFVSRVARDTGCSGEDVAWAWLIASEVAGHRAVISQLHEQESGLQLPTQTAYRWLLGLARLLERTTRWILLNIPRSSSTAQVIEQNRGGVASLRKDFGSVVAGMEKDLFESRVVELEQLGASRKLAERMMTLRFLDQLLEIVGVARETSGDLLDVARVFYLTSDLLDVSRLQEAVFSSARDDQWEQRAAQILSDDLNRAHHMIVSSIMRDQDGIGDPASAVDAFFQPKMRHMQKIRDLLEEMGEEEPSLAAQSVAVREIANLANGASFQVS